MIFQSLMGVGKSRCDVLSGTTQGYFYPTLMLSDELPHTWLVSFWKEIMSDMIPWGP
jgi:hypothetical protein